MKTIVAAIYAFNHVSLTNVQLMCPKAAETIMGIM
jgi:hypothetical protein